jgi:CheY-like chemotaxis protein
MGNGETVLVVDDVEEQREIASEMLSKLGYLVSTVASGEEAVAYLKSKGTDLLILDMIMDPGIDGLDTYKQIIQFHPGQKAIIASGYSETNRVKEAQRLGKSESPCMPNYTHPNNRKSSNFKIPRLQSPSNLHQFPD